jgi:hypothetical protein
MDPSRILDVPKDADKATIAKAFRKIALKYHPDKAGDNSEIKSQHVGLAYEILISRISGFNKGSNMAHSSSRPSAIHHLQTMRRRACQKKCPVCSGPFNVPEFIVP